MLRSGTDCPPQNCPIIIIIIIMMIIIIIIIIMIIIIALKGAIRGFLQSPHCAANSNTYAQAARAQSYANHVQHIERLSRATCRVPLGSSAINFDRV